ncbi:MAG TPA: hypothetical protein VGE51_15735 [Fontimonas sp.]
MAIATGLLLCSGLATAESLKTEDATQALTVQVMQAVSRSDLDAAYKAMMAVSVLPAAEIEAALKASKAQRNAAFTARFGTTFGYDFVRRQKLGDSVLRYVYIEKAGKQPIPWNFSFYKTTGGWVLNEFGWSGQPASIYGEN